MEINGKKLGVSIIFFLLFASILFVDGDIRDESGEYQLKYFIFCTLLLIIFGYWAVVNMSDAFQSKTDELTKMRKSKDFKKNKTTYEKMADEFETDEVKE